MNNVFKSQKAKGTMDGLAWWLERGRARQQNVLQFKTAHVQCNDTSSRSKVSRAHSCSLKVTNKNLKGSQVLFQDSSPFKKITQNLTLI